MTAEDINNELLSIVKRGDSYEIKKILESDEINVWLDSEYTLSANPNVNPILLAASLFDGLSCLKEFLNRYEDVLDWQFSIEKDNVKYKTDLLSLAIVNKNLSVIDFIANQRNFIRRLNARENSYDAISPLGQLVMTGDYEYFKEIMEIAEDNSRGEPLNRYDNAVLLYSVSYLFIMEKDNPKTLLDMLEFLSQKGFSFEEKYKSKAHLFGKFESFLNEILFSLNKDENMTPEIIIKRIQNLEIINALYNKNTKIKTSLSYKIGEGINNIYNNPEYLIDKEEYISGLKTKIDNVFKNDDILEMKAIKNSLRIFFKGLDEKTKIRLRQEGVSSEILSSIYENIGNPYKCKIVLEKYRLGRRISEENSNMSNMKQSIRNRI